MAFKRDLNKWPPGQNERGIWIGFNAFLPHAALLTNRSDYLFLPRLKQDKQDQTSLIEDMVRSTLVDSIGQLKVLERKEIEVEKTVEIQDLARRAVPPIVPNDLFSPA